MNKRIILALIIMSIAFLATGCKQDNRDTYVKLVSDYLTYQDVNSDLSQEIRNGYLAQDINKGNETIFISINHSQHFTKGETIKVKLTNWGASVRKNYADVCIISFEDSKQSFKRYQSVTMFAVIEADQVEVEKPDEAKK